MSVDLSEFFSIRESGDERGHPFMLAKFMVNTTIRQLFFTVRVVKHRHKSPSEGVLTALLIRSSSSSTKLEICF